MVLRAVRFCVLAMSETDYRTIVRRTLLFERVETTSRFVDFEAKRLVYCLVIRSASDDCDKQRSLKAERVSAVLTVVGKDDRG